MKFIWKPSKVLYGLLILMPFVDLLTGYAFNMHQQGLITYLGQCYRILTILFASYLLFVHKFEKKVAWLMVFTMYLMFLVLINYARFHTSMMEDFSYTLKLLLPMYLVYCIIVITRSDRQFVDKVYRVYSWIYPLSLVLPRVLGIGFYVTNYAFGSGYKGFYYANNELNVILMVLFVYCFQKLYDSIMAKGKGSNVIKLDGMNLIKLILIIFALLLIGSKTSILAILFVCLAYLFRGERLVYKLKYIAAFLSVGVVSILGVGTLLSNQINNIALRIIYTYHRYIDGGFLTFLLSKRNLRIQPGFDYWYPHNGEGIVNFLFGVGKDTKCPTDGISVDAFAMIEMDFFDSLFWFGIIATCIVMVFYLYFFFQSRKVKHLFMEKTMFLLVFSFSMIAGHIITSANSGTIFALVTADLASKVAYQRKRSTQTRDSDL